MMRTTISIGVEIGAVGWGMGDRAGCGPLCGLSPSPPRSVPNKSVIFLVTFRLTPRVGTRDTRDNRSVGPTSPHRRFKATRGHLKGAAPARMRSARCSARQRALRPRRRFTASAALYDRRAFRLRGEWRLFTTAALSGFESLSGSGRPSRPLSLLRCSRWRCPG